MFDGRELPTDGEGDGQAARRTSLHAALDALLDGSEDPSVLIGAESAILLEAAHELQLSVDGAATRVTARWAASEDWRAAGCGSAAAWLVAQMGASRVAAHARLRTARLAAPMAHVSSALARGVLPAAQNHELVRARTEEVLEAFDRDEAALVQAACTLHADAFKAHLASWRIDALTELGRNHPDPRPGPLTERDRLHVTRTFGSRGVLDGELSPESTATLAGALDAEIDAWHRSGALSEDSQRSRAELQADALLAIIARGAHRGDVKGAPRPRLIVLVDLDTILGRALGNTEARMRRRAEILGGGPVTDAVVQRLLCDADLSLVLTAPGGEPLWVGRASRTATPAQWRALLARTGGNCEWPGCTEPHEHADAHHLQWWSDQGATDLPNLAVLCHHHHQALHRGGFHAARAPNGLMVTDARGVPVVARYGNRDAA